MKEGRKDIKELTHFLTTEFDILEKLECLVCQTGISGFFSTKMEDNFIYFTSWTIQACFSGYAHVSWIIWLNFTQETKK
jgi:hypothetical protein